jgi:ribosomal protein S18 acetylase RimI-like enzyme
MLLYAAHVCRQGIGRAMLQACDQVVKARHHSSIWLHVRQADEAAQQLYGSFGYEEVNRDKPKIALFGVSSDKTRPRILMKRQLP